MRRVRNSNRYACRFKFPQPLCEESSFGEENGGIVFIPKRNDPLLNRYNKLITQTWRANIDIAIITSIDAILNYIAKYVSKGEVASSNFTELIARIADSFQADDNGTSIIRKLLQASLTGRDYSAQEVCHVLMGWPMFESTRTFVVLNLNENQYVPIDAPDHPPSNDMMTRHRTRARSLNVSLFDFYKNFKIGRNQVKRRHKCTIVRVFPKIKNAIDGDMQESFYKQQLTLHIPWWHSPKTLLQRSNEPPIDTWAEAYEFHNLIPDNELPLNENDDEFEAIEPRNRNEFNLEMALARIRQDRNEVRPLCERIIDFEVDWARPREFDYSLSRVRSFLSNFRVQPLNNVEQQLPSNPSNEQREIHQLCCRQINEIIDGDEPQINRVLIQGKAGTGKSFLINRMVHTIRSRLGNEAVQVLAPTGVAATNIGGSTIHSFLKIPVFARFQPLSGNAQRQFQLQMEPVKFLIFDEYSMIGLDAWRKIEHVEKHIR